jgi:hypothetical protein
MGAEYKQGRRERVPFDIQALVFKLPVEGYIKGLGLRFFSFFIIKLLFFTFPNRPKVILLQTCIFRLFSPSRSLFLHPYSQPQMPLLYLQSKLHLHLPAQINGTSSYHTLRSAVAPMLAATTATTGSLTVSCVTILKVALVITLWPALTGMLLFSCAIKFIHANKRYAVSRIAMQTAN